MAPIGAGGMGEVYRAHDTRLGREVAIKVLPAELAADRERLTRFEREAKATAALSHPNILDIHDVGTFEGIPYLVEELLEGESLRERLGHGAIPVDDAVGIAAQVARGLAAAHEKGIVHRDLKPENVFLTRDGTVKILDFGLAKLVERTAGEADTLTHAPTGATELGRVLGTVAYMAPEQARGMAVDQRTDIFALGVVLYEILAGERPFRGETATDTVAAILKEEPAPLPAAVPPALRELVGRCLKRRPEERFSSAHELGLALWAVLGGVETPAPAQVAPAVVPSSRRRAAVVALIGVALLAAIAGLIVKLRSAGPRVGVAALKKIVVLPFENLGLPEDAYFASGMAEEITSRLANVQGLGVISRTTATAYDRHGKTVKQIGADLGVDYVLEGSVRFEHGQGRESRVRITPQLIRVADDTHVWADRYDRVLADVFAIQSEVAESAVKAMGVTLLPHEQTRLKEISTNDLEAYDLALQGVELIKRGFNREFVEGALEKFQAAVDRDPRFAQALALAASQHLTMYWLHYDHSPERLAKGKELAERAVELRPDLAETHAALAQYYYHGLLDFPRALDELAKATTIQPNNTMVLHLEGLVLARQGRFVEAAHVLGKAVELDPANQNLLSAFAGACVRVRRYADADRALALAITLSPRFAFARAYRAEIQVKWHGDLDKAQALLDEASRVPGVREHFSGSWEWVAWLRRDYQGVLRQLEAREPHVRGDPKLHSDLLLFRGQVQMLVGQGDLARRSYEAARAEFEQLVRQNPRDAELHGSLGIAYAALGRRADAVREAKLGCDLVLDKMDPWFLAGPAQIYTMVGEPGEAITLLDKLLSESGSFTVPTVRLDPTWDPLRSDPRFQALLTKYAVKT
ncbi:MAG: protein kinase domain-containing protein [Acidobacteriota bacterium]